MDLSLGGLHLVARIVHQSQHPNLGTQVVEVGEADRQGGATATAAATSRDWPIRPRARRSRPRSSRDLISRRQGIALEEIDLAGLDHGRSSGPSTTPHGRRSSGSRRKRLRARVPR